MEKAMERVLEVMEWAGLNAHKFCVQIGFGYTTFKNYMSGIRPAKDLDLYKNVLSTYVEISAEWLIRGEGPMIKTDVGDNNSNDRIVLLEKIDEQQDTIVKQSREIGRLEGRIEELEKKYTIYPKGQKAATPTTKYKKKKDE